MASRAIGQLLGASAHSPIETNAGKTVHMELRRSGDETLLHLVNPERLWNDRAPKQRDVAISIEMPPDVSVAEVRLTSPEPPDGSAADEKQGIEFCARASEPAGPARR